MANSLVLSIHLFLYGSSRRLPHSGWVYFAYESPALTANTENHSETPPELGTTKQIV